MSDLVPGGNVPLPGGTLTIRVPGPFDVSALITDDSGKVRGDADFVFYNQPTVPGARLAGENLTIDPPGLRSGASRVTVVISPADPGTPLGRLPAPTLHVTGPGGHTLARFTPPRPQRETVLLLAEIYRRGTAWKLRALGQGYADGLAGIARDFGVEVAEDVSEAPAPSVAAPDPDGFLDLVNSVRTVAGSPPVSLDARLATAAHAHASDMAARGLLSSESANGISVHQRITSTGYAYLTVGEHLVSGPRTPGEFVEYCLTTEQSRSTLYDAAYSQAGLAYVAAPAPATCTGRLCGRGPSPPGPCDRRRVRSSR